MLISLLVAVIVIGLIFFILGQLAIPQPFKNIAMAIVGVVAIIWLLGFVDWSQWGHWHRLP